MKLTVKILLKMPLNATVVVLGMVTLDDANKEQILCHSVEKSLHQMSWLKVNCSTLFT